jgi:hypothetical protein
MKLILSLCLFSLLACGQFIDTTLDLPTNIGGVGAFVGPTRADGGGFGAYARLLNRDSGTYSLTGAAVVPSLVPASNGLKQIALRTTMFTGIEQVFFKRGRVMLVGDAGVGAAMPLHPGGSVVFSGNYAAAAVLRTGQSAGASKYAVGGIKFIQIQSTISPLWFGGYAIGW